MGDNLRVVDLGAALSAVSMDFAAAGISSVSCARLSDGSTKCWGSNRHEA
jgi:hypothetical protein